MIKRILIFGMIVLTPAYAFAQGFGKNKVQYHEITWLVLQSKYFDIHFYEGGKYIAEFAADILDEALEKMQRDFDYNIKKRIPIVVYKSHNDFQQTNVVMTYMEEGIGGVTESFKNRVVVPFEGSYKSFRHVLVHELVHAYMNDMIYGGSVQSIVTGAVRLQLPLWYAEGMAEYLSLDWDTRADMVLRDGTIYGYLGSMSPYQQGQSLMRYIADKYGKEKIPDILRKVNITKDIERGFMSALGIDLEKLSKQWTLAMKRKYWPDIAERQNPEEFATRLTNHVEDQHFLNLGGTISPNGDKIVYITNKDGYIDVNMISAIDGESLGKLIGGQRNPDLEELKWLTPGMSWSPDGKYVVLSVKAGDQDALTIIDVRTKKYKQHKFGLDGIYGADWSSVGSEITFMGVKDGTSDIYSFNVRTKEHRRITNDYFSDKSPSWSPDGTQILFVSDRKDYIDPENGASSIYMQKHNFESSDIYLMNSDGSNIERITYNDTEDGFPVWSPDGKKMAFTSERNGISNIYIMDMNTRESYPITNALTGCFQLSWSKEGSKLVFTSYYEGGYDVYMIKNPLLKDSKADIMKNTVFFVQLEEEKNNKNTTENIGLAERLAEEARQRSQRTDLSQYIFDDRARSYVEDVEKNRETFKLDPADYKESDGSYKVKKYKLKFTPDIIQGNYGYDTFFGMQGSSMIQFSDMLGNHSVIIGTDLYFDLRNSDYQIFYFYLPKKTDYAVGFYNYVNFFTNAYNVGGYYYYIPIRLKNSGATVMASRPFSKYSRIDFNLGIQQVSQEYLSEADFPSYNKTLYRASLNLVRDTSFWGFLGPVDGDRGSLTLTYSPPIGKKTLNPADTRISYFTAIGDYRKYYRVNRDYSLAFRLTSGMSEGETPETFFLGGVPNWLNRKFKDNIRTELNDIFFSYWIDPLRGSSYYELVGNRYALMNTEFRFPFIRQLMLGFPLPARFQDIRGALFWDMGAAWFNNNFKLTTTDDSNRKILRDFRTGFGTGVRIFLGGFFLLRVDAAWNYDYTGISKPMYYISMGGNW